MMTKRKLAAALGTLLLFSTVHMEEATAKTATLQVKSTVDVLNVREKPSTNAKIVGKLKKGQKLPMIYLNTDNGYQKAFYEVRYQNKKAYVSADYVKEIKPTGKGTQWLGSYTDAISGGTGYDPSLYVYKQTSKKVYYASYVGYRMGFSADSPFKHVLYKGTATLTSATKARVQVNNCKGTWTLKGNIISGKADNASCFSNDIFAAVIPEYGRYQRLKNGSL